MSSNPLLQEFPPVSTETWEAVIRKDLKGADYAKRLIWQSEDGLAVKPYYRAEDIAGLQYFDAPPGNFPYVRSTRANGNWRIREEIDALDRRKANQAATAALAAGAEEIEFRTVRIRNASDLNELLANLRDVRVHFHDADESLLQVLTEAEHSVRGGAGFDPLKNLNLAAKVLGSARPDLIPFTIDAGRFEEAGATAPQEIGFALAAGIDFLAEMHSRNVDINRAAASISFSFAIGSNYFFQIAKLRSFRLLWARAVASFGGSSEAAKAHIHARTSRWNETIYNPHVNILRGTTEAMSAALGGADSITVAPFDECYKAPDEASRRLARNTQILLKQESQLARVSDPGGGSYYLEVITDFVASESWKTMQGIESAGGYQKARAAGTIDQALAQSRAAKEKAVATRRRVFVGTNQYPNLSEKVLDQIDNDHAAALEQFGHRRGAELYEQIRLRTERHVARGGKNPRVLLAEIGDLKMRSARSTFATNFFGCAGFDVIAQHFDAVDDIADTPADVIVLCSSDPEYPAIAATLIAALEERKRNISIIVAGNPESTEQLKAMGVSDFIHVRSNPVEVLARWQQKLGVKE